MSTVDTELDLRKLDAEIAEKVMGWKHGDNHTYCDRPFVSCPVCLTRFSTDIAAAMNVVEKMVAQGYDWQCKSLFGQTYSVTFSDGRECDPQISEAGATYTGEYKRYEETETTLPLAICRAALQAINRE